MHLPTSFFLLLINLVPITAANPFSSGDDNWDGHEGHSSRYGCLSDSSANTIVDKFENFFVQIDNNTAKRYLAADFQGYLTSVATSRVVPVAELDLLLALIVMDGSLAEALE